MADAEFYEQQVRLLLESLPYAADEEVFALKGGTAINLFVRDMPRLSVDIDLTYLPVHGREESLEEIGLAMNRIASRIEQKLKGVRVERMQQRQDSQTTKLLVRRRGVKIKIETSPVTRGCVKEPSIREVMPSVEEQFGFAECRVVHIDDLYAGKICAALDRQHPRDFFDVKCLMEAEGISDELLDVFVVYLISSNQPIAKLLAPNLIDLEETYRKQFVRMTSDAAPLEDLEAIRIALIKEINLRLTDDHRNFLIGFKKGSPDWSLLKVQGVDALPSVRWKMLNLDKMKVDARDAAVAKLSGVLFNPLYGKGDR